MLQLMLVSPSDFNVSTYGAVEDHGRVVRDESDHTGASGGDAYKGGGGPSAASKEEADCGGL